VAAVAARVDSVAHDVASHAASASQHQDEAARRHGDADERLAALADELRGLDARVGALHDGAQSTAAELATLAQLSGELGAVQAQVGGIAEALGAVRERVDSVERVANDSVTSSLASLTEARTALEQRVTQLEAAIQQNAEEVGDRLDSVVTREYVDNKLDILDGTRGELDIANKQIELSRIAIDDLWSSLGQMASRIVGIESLADAKLAAISSARSSSTPQNKQKAKQWIDKLIRRAPGDLLASPGPAAPDESHESN
jgi:chromosome segregation ATPase